MHAILTPESLRLIARSNRIPHLIRPFHCNVRAAYPGSFLNLGARALALENLHFSKQSGASGDNYVQHSPSLQLLQSERELAEGRKQPTTTKQTTAPTPQIMGHTSAKAKILEEKPSIGPSEALVEYISALRRDLLALDKKVDGAILEIKTLRTARNRRRPSSTTFAMLTAFAFLVIVVSSPDVLSPSYWLSGESIKEMMRRTALTPSKFVGQEPRPHNSNVGQFESTDAPDQSLTTGQQSKQAIKAHIDSQNLQAPEKSSSLAPTLSDVACSWLSGIFWRH